MRYRLYYLAACISLLFLFIGCAPTPSPSLEAEGYRSSFLRSELSKRAEEVTTTVEAYSRPAWVDNAVIYEVFVTDFTQQGTFRAMLPRLPELKELGVNTVWLMPIHPIGVKRHKGTLGSPYAIRDYYGINPKYGTKEDFQALVDGVHKQGMHLILDLVANHTAWDNAWLAEHPDWYTKGADGKITHPPGTDWTDVADLNYNNPKLRDQMENVMKYWVEQFDIDGYRCDVAESVPLDFWKEAISDLRSVKPIVMLAEGADPKLHRSGFDLTYAWPFYGKLKEVWRSAPVSELIDLLRSEEAALPSGAHRLRFTTNHDETAWDAPPPALFDTKEGSIAAFVIAMAVPGIPLIYNGQEVGVSENMVFFEKNTLNWSQNPELRDVYDKLLEVYNGSEALRHGWATYLAPEADGVMLLERKTLGDRLIVAVNVRNRAVAMPLPKSLHQVALTNLLTGKTVTAGTLKKLELAPYSYALLRVE